MTKAKNQYRLEKTNILFKSRQIFQEFLIITSK